MDERSYLRVLIDSLTKKLLILGNILVLSQEQRELLLDDQSDPDDIELNVIRKDEFIDQINRIDEGFDEVYAHVSETLSGKTSQYADEVRHMQSLIKDILAKDTLIRALESENHDLAQKRFEKVRKQIREVRVSQKTVNTYYQNMMRVQTGMDPRFVDNKK